MKDNKPWYEKVGTWVGIVAGVCTILAFIISLYTKFNNITITDKQNDDIQDTDDENANLSEEELLIKRNWDLIQQLKTKYLEEDTKIVQGNSVFFKFYENAGYVYSDLMGTEQCCMLQGAKVLPSKMIVLDYDSDVIIYTFTPKKSNYIRYSPENQERFYCVVFCENYDIYVTPPFHVVGSGDFYIPVDICLNRIYDKYTPLFKVRTYKRDLKLDEGFYYCSSDYIVEFNCKNTYSNEEKSRYFAKVLDSGILSFHNGIYFSLNTNYVMDFSLYHKSNPNLQLSNNTFDGSITNTNLVDIYFTINNENDTVEQTEE